MIKHPFEAHTLQSTVQNTKANRMPVVVPLDSYLLGRTCGLLIGLLVCFFRAVKHLLQGFIGKYHFQSLKKVISSYMTMLIYKMNTSNSLIICV